jgi:hypothetical protein
MAVDELLLEDDALASQRVHDELVNGPERLLRKRVGAETVLIGHHDEFEVSMLTDESQIAEHPFLERQFAEVIDLLVKRLLDKGSVAVDE